MTNVMILTFPKADLDSSTNLAGKYIMLDRVDVHCIWVSSPVLSLLPTPFPVVPGGEIITDPGPGVFCDNAMDIVLEHWPKPTREKKIGFIKNAMNELNKVGLVGMADAGVTPGDLSLYEDLAEKASDDREGDWTVRVYAMIECDKRNTFCPEQAPWIERADGMLSVKSVKLFGGAFNLTQTMRIGYQKADIQNRWCLGKLGKCYARTLL
jgi:predicted amidohydrolase YtcJ